MGFIVLMMMASSTAFAFAVDGMLSNDDDNSDTGSDENTETSTDTDVGDLLDEQPDDTSDDDGSENGDDAEVVIVDDETSDTTDEDDEPAEGTHHEFTLAPYDGEPTGSDTLVFDDFDPEVDTITITLPVSTDEFPISFYEVHDGILTRPSNVDDDATGQFFDQDVSIERYISYDHRDDPYDDVFADENTTAIWVDYDYYSKYDEDIDAFVSSEPLGYGRIAVPVFAFTNLDEVPWDAITIIDPAVHSEVETTGSNEDERLIGSAVADTIYGGGGDDTITGFPEAVYNYYEGTVGLGNHGASDGVTDYLYGEDGDDTIYGYDDDIVDGGNGNDDLHADGAVIMTGGAGADVFTVSESDDVSVITDFDPTEDRLVLNIDLPTLYEGGSPPNGPIPDYLVEDPVDNGRFSLVDGAITKSEVDGDTHLLLAGKPLAVVEGVTDLDLDTVETIGTFEWSPRVHGGSFIDVVETV